MVPSLWLISLLLSVSHGFMSPPPSPFGRTKLSRLYTATQKGVETITRNVFHDYDKPIVLVGCSGDGKEMMRLAKSLQEELGASNESPLGCQIVQPWKSSGSELHLTEDFPETLRTKKYKWPDILLLDFGDDAFSLDQGKHAEKLESHYSTLVKSLCSDHRLLSIYINVSPHDSKMSEAALERKSRLENDVFVKYTDYEVCIRDEVVNAPGQNDGWSHIEWELARTIARARLIPAIPGDKTRTYNTAHLTMGAHTFFLSLSFPEVSQVEPYVEEMCRDVDAMEYRTDLLDCRDSRFDLIYGMQLLRKYCRPHTVRVPSLPFAGKILEDVMPIVYTVRTQNQAGTYPDDAEGISKMFELLKWGLRGGVEVLDVESAWDKERTNDLLNLAEERYASQILGSHHVVGEEVTTEEAVRLFQQCALNGRAHGAKVVLSIESEKKDRMAYDAATIAASLAATAGEPEIPNISLILGDVGKFSRVLNHPFTPVTHESLPFKAAPGQMTSNEIMTVRLLTKTIERKRYGILGHNIAYSVSPEMQGAAFAATRLPHEYVRIDVPTVEEFIESDFFKSGDFGGCSVTIPHKQAIIPYIDVMSESAKAIGSVNTVVVKDEVGEHQFERVIYGDNTDWKGIFNPLQRKMGGPGNPDVDYALILGAGGTARAAAFAAEKLGMQRLFYNRTPSKATELAEEFGGIVVTSLEEKSSDVKDDSLGEVLSASKGSSLRAVISTLPAAAEFVLPDWLLKPGSEKPIVFDVNYKPFNTKLLLQAERAGCQLVRGSEMLWEQGVGQFELWTGRSAPYSVMKHVVLQNCLPQEEESEE